MKLTEFNAKPSMIAKKALNENFNTKINLENMSLYDTKRMLTKVKGVVAEMRQGNEAGKREQNPAYLKAVMLEQALMHHYGELKALPMYNQRIVVENEEVEKSQVILAAQEMVDSIQKMVEEVSDMLVKELPAVVDGVNSEVGTNEGQQFNDQVTQALTALQAALTGSKTGIQGALNIITGQAGGFSAEPAMGDMGAAPDMGGDMASDELGGEVSDLAGDELGGEVPEEEPEEMTPSLGRATR